MTAPADPARAAQLLDALGVYQPARQAFVASLRPPTATRDPLAEFYEQFVHALLGGTLAASRVQRDYDLILDDGAKVQVRHLANQAGAAGAWVNEHVVRRQCDRSV